MIAVNLKRKGYRGEGCGGKGAGGVGHVAGIAKCSRTDDPAGDVRTRIAAIQLFR